MKRIKNKTITAGIALLLIMAVFTACTEAESKTENLSGIIPLQTYTYTADDLNEEWSEDETTAKIVLADENTTITGSGASYENGVLTINSAGTYLINGTIKNGQLCIDAGDSDTVRLILNGVSITNESAPALFEKNSHKTIVTLAKDSKNTLRDGSDYTDTNDGDPDAALYATHDLTINGKGELVVHGSYNNAIGSQDNLCIVDSKINVSVKNNGLKGRDLLAAKDVDLTVTSESDGIKSNNDQSASKGFTQIDGGTYDITAKNDGIQAETNLIINSGNMNIKTTGTVDSSSTATTESQSMKALKASSQIAVRSGTFNLNSTDDAVHSNGNITIDGGDFNISTGDDGFHADGETIINDGKINIKECYEGIEGATVEINGGEIDIIASDDGINAAGGSDDETDTDSDEKDQGQGPMGEDEFTANENNHIKITDGTLTITSQGDGIDSNGDLYFEGGTVNVSGPSNGAEGPLDANGEIYMNGGDVIVSGNTSMARVPSDDSTQNSLIMVPSSNLAKEDTVYVTDSNGKVILEHAPANDYQLMILSSPNLKKGETYSVCSGSKDNVLFKITINDTNTIVDESGNTIQLNTNGGQPGGNGDQPQNKNGGDPPSDGTPPNAK